MKTELNKIPTVTQGCYAALRHGGEPVWRARVALGLADEAAARLERQFQRRRDGGPDPMRPRFARHAEHVAAVLGEGGYPVLR